MVVSEPGLRAATIHARIAGIAARRADRLSLSAPEARWTYADLSQRVVATAGALAARGVSPGDRVAHLFELEPAAVAAGLGALEAGAVWVPLDPAWPDERIAGVLADAEPVALLCGDDLAGQASRLAGDRPVTTAREAFAGRPVGAPDRSPAVEEAMLLFTSGSTGVPKGVVIGHRGLLANVDGHRRALELDERDRIAMTVRPCYLAGMTSLLRGLLAGAAVVLRDVRRVGTVGLADWLREESITVLQTTPTVFRQLAATAGEVPFPGLRWLHLGGERSAVGDVERLAALPMPNARFLHNYGSTEAGTVCQLRLAPGERFDGLELPVGAPVPGKRVRLVDDFGAEVPTGRIGEIVVESRDLLALGYWRRPEETARAFSVVQDGAPELRAFRTGDLGRLDESGRLVHLGRVDGQLQLGGQRIETGEIESRLADHPSVAEAAVTVEKGGGESPRLVAHVVPSPDVELDAEALRRHLLRSLPTQMIPALWRARPALPRTPTGKVDRSALEAGGAAPEDSKARVSGASAGPDDDPIRAELAQIWERLLDRPGIRPADDFFVLGGTSLLTIELCLEVRSRLACELEPSTVYAHPTLQAMADLLRTEEVRPTATGLLFHRDGGRPAVACVPGNLTSPRVALRGLLEGLGTDQPVVAFQDRPGLPTRMEEVAELYLEEWSRLLPEPPRALIGICWGAAVAHEMARRLCERGELVELLALVEPARLFPPGWLSVARVVVPAYLGRLLRRRGDYRSELAGLDRDGRRLLLRQKRKLLRNSIALRLWRPRASVVQCEVYLTAGSIAGGESDRMVWTHLFAEPPRVLELPGDHESVTGSDGAAVDHEILAGLGRELRARLDALGAPSR